MTAEPDIATVAQAIGEPARAAMLLQLMDGDAHTARGLATVAGIAPSTASAHLRRLCDAGLVRVTESGRQRLHRLAGPDVAQLVEALTALAPPRLPPNLQPDPPTDQLLEARACYGHLGGRLGVTIAARLHEDGVIDELRPGDTGPVHTFDHPLLTTLGITGLATPPPVRACLDWSHSSVHLAGALGTALLTGLLDAGWLRRRPTGRALRITPNGRDRLAQLGFR
ncbi:ArsR family transcriptional regulator [Amycolatopsis sp. NBC_00345]|uniref:ArsR/SmtB family transcription factor n=1 Tax=Amycolatopsis sp. NBC_00345 TaxID=2975955 RepID=UPI002E259D64